MKLVCEKDMCTGCMACIDKCTKGAIHIEDSLKAYNAIIDPSKCVGCNLCYSVCQNNNSINLSKPQEWYQGWSKDIKVRESSSSGGAATSIIKEFIEEYGTVCSCVFSHGEFVFQFVDNLDEADIFSGSKYVKSNPKGIYKVIKQKLANDEKVLFVGLPCQVAAVKKYVGDKLERGLYTVDLICHGTPSPRFLKKFLSENGYDIRNIKSIQFRNKNKFHLYEDYVGIEPDRVDDAYTYAFLNSINYTENCYKCRYATQDRVSDITLGDSWGSVLSTDDKEKGISLISCQSTKGKELIKASEFNLIYVDVENAIKNNEQLIHPSNMPKERAIFFEKYFRTCNFKKSVAKTFPKVYYKQIVKKILIKMKLISGVQ